MADETSSDRAGARPDDAAADQDALDGWTPIVPIVLRRPGYSARHSSSPRRGLRPRHVAPPPPPTPAPSEPPPATVAETGHPDAGMPTEPVVLHRPTRRPKAHPTPTKEPVDKPEQPEQTDTLAWTPITRATPRLPDARLVPPSWLPHVAPPAERITHPIPTRKPAETPPAEPEPAVPSTPTSAGSTGTDHRFTSRRVFAAVIVVLVLLLAFQFAWPSGRFLPRQRIDGVDVGGMTATQAVGAVRAAYLAQPIHLVDAAGDPLHDITLSNNDVPLVQAVGGVDRFPFWQRLLPGSFFARIGGDADLVVHPTLTPADVPSLNLPAQNAVSAVVDGELQVTPGRAGFTADDPDLATTLNALDLSTTRAATVTVAGTSIDPAVTTAAATALRSTITANLGTAVTFTLAGESTTMDPTSVLATLSIDDTLAVTVDPTALQAALNAWAAPLQSAPDGTQDGLSVDWTATAQALSATLTSTDAPPDGGVTVAVSADTQPGATPSESFTDNFDGLRQELADQFGNRPYAVSVIDLTGQGRNLSINGGQVFTSASTYKIFVAYAMAQAVEQGTLTWNSPLNGTTLATCFQRMIVNSDNDCPQAWLDQYGYDTLTDQAHAIGATNTSFTVSNMRTTSDDLAGVLAKLYQGTLMDATDQQTMITAMENQVYRSGIPAGMTGHGTVADKVGFLDALLHDAAIVYSDKGDYVLVVMTNKCTWGDIAAVASAVYERM